MNKRNNLNLLFIGNSHTCCNDMPGLVRLRICSITATWQEYDMEDAA